MKVTTFKITATNTFTRTKLISNGKEVIYNNIIMIPTSDIEYRGGAGEDILVLRAGIPLNLTSMIASGGFPFEIKGVGTIDVILQGQ